MIAFLNGTVAAVLPPQTAYIDVAGVGYAVAMPGGDLGKLAVGDTARVLTYLSVTENGIALFGFLSEEEKVLFEKLIGVSKVGPKMALAALSTFSPAELADAIASQDIARVSHIPGVGKKTAERIILELKGTLEAGMESLFSQGDVRTRAQCGGAGGYRGASLHGLHLRRSRGRPEGGSRGRGRGRAATICPETFGKSIGSHGIRSGHRGHGVRGRAGQRGRAGLGVGAGARARGGPDAHRGRPGAGFLPAP